MSPCLGKFSIGRMRSNRRVIYALDSKMENVIYMEQVPLEITLWGSLLGHEG